MAYTADLTIEGKTFQIIRYEYSFSQEVDLFGKPVPRVTSDMIRVELYGTGEETAISWAANNRKKLDGTIAIYKTDQSVLKEIKFEDAYCVKYREDIRLSTIGDPNSTYKHFLEISAKVIEIGDSKHDNHWSE